MTTNISVSMHGFTQPTYPPFWALLIFRASRCGGLVSQLSGSVLAIIPILKQLGMPDSINARFKIVSDTCHPAPWYLNSDKVFLLLSDQYGNPKRGFEPGSSMSVYLNLTHALNRSATTVGFTSVFFCLLLSSKQNKTIENKNRMLLN